MKGRLFDKYYIVFKAEDERIAVHSKFAIECRRGSLHLQLARSVLAQPQDGESSQRTKTRSRFDGHQHRIIPEEQQICIATVPQPWKPEGMYVVVHDDALGNQELPVLRPPPQAR